MVGPVDHRHLNRGNLRLALARARRDVGEEVLAAARAVRQRAVRVAVEARPLLPDKGESFLAGQLVAAKVRLKIALDS